MISLARADATLNYPAVSEDLSALSRTAGPLPSGVIDLSRSNISLNPAVHNMSARSRSLAEKIVGSLRTGDARWLRRKSARDSHLRRQSPRFGANYGRKPQKPAA